jgi:hypothetical protein
MKICYIAHPIGGDVEGNLRDLRRIIRKINLEFPDVVPFCPYYADVVSLDDSILRERGGGLRNDIEIIERKIPHEIWLTGLKISKGMRLEIMVAKKAGIPVINKIGVL